MLESASNRQAVRGHVAQVRELLEHPDLQEHLERAGRTLSGDGDGTPLQKLHEALDPERVLGEPAPGAPADEAPYLSRSPLVSLVQSTVEEQLHRDGLHQPPPSRRTWLDKIIRAVRRLFGLDKAFRQGDPGWYLGIAAGVLSRIADANHPFNDAPAEFAIDDRARVLLVGDWGTGLPRAQDVAVHMRAEIATALEDGRQVHVIHLGDVYYSGLDSEDRRHFLDFWPVSAEQAQAGVTSWSLNGNHDMYSGGHGYFQTLLADPRFRNQKSPDGAPTSFFRLRSASWDFVGLDTAYYWSYFWEGQSAKLHEPQAAYVADTAQSSPRKLVLLSHHQLVSAYDQEDISDELKDKLAPVLDADRVTAWWWGHEHRAVAYQASGGVRYPRCLGNGGVPVPVDGPPPADAPVEITWRSGRSLTSGGKQWTRFGFAVLDLDGPAMHVRYVDDDGDCPYEEDIE